MQNRNEKIAKRFGAKHQAYDKHANVQQHVALQLINFLPEKKNPKILEIGCGTGFLTKALFKKYPTGSFHITDLSQDMLTHCQLYNKHDNARFFTMDAQNPQCDNDYDFIVSSMTFQWLEYPVETLRNLSQKGDVYFSTIGQKNFKEWKKTLKKNDLKDRTLPSIEYPNVLQEEIIKKDYQNGLNFLQALKRTGASTSFSDQKNRNITSFKNALSTFDGKVSWHIVYGFQARDDTVIGTR